MTKTLTEQYKFGEIKTGYYWCKIWGEDVLVIKWLVGDNEIHQSNLIEEVLAPVTDYDKVKEMSQKIERLEFDNEALEMAHNEGKEINAELVSKNEQLEKKLAIATKALKSFIPDDISDGGFGEMYEDVIWDCKKALKEMEDVK